MTEDLPDDGAAFLAMAREFPLRTCLFTFGLPAFALLQLLNGLYYDGVLPYVALLAAMAVALSVVLTRYQLATYRRKQLMDAISRDA
jgi:hypothetical protein